MSKCVAAVAALIALMSLAACGTDTANIPNVSMKTVPAKRDSATGARPRWATVGALACTSTVTVC